ncbi:APC family permease [Bacillus cereus]|uniref:APC family permease n=1 Tax=Bacillus cereus TaxID=1396 RepID=UPI00398088FD
MHSKSALFASAIGIIFIIVGIFRFFDFSIPSIVVALMSVMAALISLSDVLEITQFRKYGLRVQFLALGFFIILMIIWLLRINVNSSLFQTIGDGFTVIGLGFVIGLYGLKETFEYRRKEEVIELDEGDVIESDEEDVIESDEMIRIYKFEITSNEHKEMMKLNDIIERLKALDQKVFPSNKVHSGWSLFHDSLADYWNKLQGPFFDGVNRNKYHEFLCALGSATDKIGSVSDSDDPRTFEYTEVEMWNEMMTIHIQPRMNNSYLPSTGDLIEGIDKALSLWDELKVLVNRRYEQERSIQKQKV